MQWYEMHIQGHQVDVQGLEAALAWVEHFTSHRVTMTLLILHRADGRPVFDLHLYGGAMLLAVLVDVPPETPADRRAA